MTRRPNVLFLMSDEHRADVAGFAGNRVVRTPFLDELARTGTTFSNAYTPSPICIPARQCLAAGKYPRNCGVERYGQDLPPNSLTWARVFSQFAYQTVACGKLHHTGTDQMQGWTRRVGLDESVESGFIAERDAASFEAMKARPDGRDADPKWSDAKEIQRAGIGRGPHTAVRDDFALVGAKLVADEHFLDPFYDRASPHQPIVLYLGLSNPHYPYLADEDGFRHYLPRVEPFLDEKPFPHPWLGKSPFMPDAVQIGRDVSAREVRRATAAYYANIEKIDEQFGELARHLESVGQNLDEWIVIYTSDHGEMLGQHGIWEKQKFFEASARVPLIIRWPKEMAGGQIVSQNVNLIDLFATLCELCDLPVPPNLDSRSLVPLLKGDASDWDNETLSQFGGRHLMIKRDALKYQFYGEDGPEVLFDLERNPDETSDFSHEPAYSERMGEFQRRRSDFG
ncbi:MAG: sulfatase-like hydrolase/transferase [Armatimonadetes bacterium]|nr:sulfatase-like hydrolase/transferase [Armatimonadota bacterium]